jgi:hypothetical protein
MKHFDPQEGEPTAGSPGFKCFAPSRLWLSEASLRALYGRLWDRFLRET